MYVKGNDSMGTKILYQKVAADLKRRILDGDYEVGGLIPSEGELERYYQVSKITIPFARRSKFWSVRATWRRRVVLARALLVTIYLTSCRRRSRLRQRSASK